MSITITWHGHSCFSVSADGYSIVLDPYAPDSVPGLPPLSLSASQVLCSHGHSDHGYTDAVDLSAGKQGSPFTVTVIQTFHDDQNGSLRGENRIHILEADDLRIAHLGDLGCTLEPGQMELLKDLDAIMIPVGGYYTIDAAQAMALVEAVKPRIVIPMHYRSDTFGYDVIGRLEDYTKLCRDVVTYASASMVLEKDTPAQTAVLSLQQPGAAAKGFPGVRLPFPAAPLSFRYVSATPPDGISALPLPPPALLTSAGYPR